MRTVASTGAPEKSRSNREDYGLHSQPDDCSLRCATTRGPKITVFWRKSWNRWFAKWDRRVSEPALPSETGRIGESVGGLVVGKGERGNNNSGVRAKEERLEERLKKWEKGDRLFLADESPTLPSNPPPSDNAPSP